MGITPAFKQLDDGQYYGEKNLIFFSYRKKRNKHEGSTFRDLTVPYLASLKNISNPMLIGFTNCSKM